MHVCACMYLSVCMYMCVYACLCVCLCMCACMHRLEENLGYCCSGALTIITYHFLFLSLSLPWLATHWLGYVAWPSSPRRLPVSASLALRLPVDATTPDFIYMGCGGLNLGPYAYKTSTLQIEPSAQCLTSSGLAVKISMEQATNSKPNNAGKPALPVGSHGEGIFLSTACTWHLFSCLSSSAFIALLCRWKGPER